MGGLRGSCAAGLVAVATIVSQQTVPCAMRPSRPAFALPPRGIVSVAPDDDCDALESGGWERRPADTLEVRVRADGPGGSGRYWRVTVGLARPADDSLLRGLCYTTTTLGWRTLQAGGETSLAMPWVDDRDHDGRPELVVWDSFPLRRDATPAEFALVAWVYEFDGRATFGFDVKMSRAIARDIAAAYRVRVDADPLRKRLRNQAEQSLTAFASGRCSARAP